MGTTSKLTVAIGSDHAGFEMKESIKKWLTELKYEVKDYGTFSSESTDYPDVAHPLATAIESKRHTMGILLCGSANGMAVTANKHQGIRAAICWNEETATLSRLHNNANVLCLPARFIDEELARKITDRFLTEDFEGGRHDRRISKIGC
jgi:ribose 5-phosphate isomerase B